MKKHNALKVVLISLLVFLVLSWIFPAAYYSGEYVDQGRVQMGLNDTFNYLMTSVSYFGHFSLYLILVGSFYGILYKIPAYRTFLDRVVNCFRGKEKLFLALVVVLFSLGVSLGGLQIGFAIFVPFVVSIILLMGYDKVTAALTVVGSLAAGLIGSTYSYGNLSLVTSLLSLDIDYQVGVRFVLLAVCVILVIFNMFMYISGKKATVKVVEDKPKKEVKSEEIAKDEVKVSEKKSEKNTHKSAKVSSKASVKSTGKAGSAKSSKTAKSNKKSKNVNKAALRDEDIIVVKESVMNKCSCDDYLIPTRVEATHKVWPFVAGFVLLFVVLVLAFITWENSFEVTIFTEATKGFNNFELFGFPIFAKLYGTVNSFGNWTVIDMFLPVNLLLLLLVIIYKVKFVDVIEGAITGAKKALVPAFIFLLCYTVLVTVTYHPFQLAIYKAILGLSGSFNIATTTIVSLLSSILNVDPSYTFQAFLPYYTSIFTNSDNYALVGIIGQSMYGFAALCGPTSLVLLSVLSYLGVTYVDWLKNVWKLLLELFVVLLIVFIILVLL